MSQCYELVGTVGLACLVLGYILGCLVTLQDWKQAEAKRAIEGQQQASKFSKRITAIITGTEKDGQDRP